MGRIYKGYCIFCGIQGDSLERSYIFRTGPHQIKDLFLYKYECLKCHKTWYNAEDEIGNTPSIDYDPIIEGS